MRLPGWFPIEWRLTRVDLGTHHGRALVGYERRTGVRLGWGGRRLELGRTRARRLEVTGPGGSRTPEVIEVPNVRDPWRLLVVGLLVLLLVSALVTAVARRGGER